MFCRAIGFFVGFCLISSSVQAGKTRFKANPNGFVPGTTYLYMLEGPIGNLSLGYDIYNLDLDTVEGDPSAARRLHQAGKKIVCYFSAGSWENTRVPNRYAGINSKSIGKKMGGWDEKWLDIRNQDVRNAQLKILESAIDAGCDAVEPDNVDHYDNDTGFNISEQESISYLHWLAQAAHNTQHKGRTGIAIALKNSTGIIESGGLAQHFDLMINEQCFTYGDCPNLKDFTKLGKAVYIIEYERTHESDPYSMKNFGRDCAYAKMNQFFFFVYYNQSVNGNIVAQCR